VVFRFAWQPWNGTVVFIFPLPFLLNYLFSKKIIANLEISQISQISLLKFLQSYRRSLSLSCIDARVELTTFNLNLEPSTTPSTFVDSTPTSYWKYRRSRCILIIIVISLSLLDDIDALYGIDARVESTTFITAISSHRRRHRRSSIPGRGRGSNIDSFLVFRRKNFRRRPFRGNSILLSILSNLFSL
jgi:hypothetical protein